MLFLVKNPAKQLKRFANDPVRGHVFRNFVNLQREDGGITQLFGDHPETPNVLLAHYCGSVMVAGEQAYYEQIWNDLYSGDVENSLISSTQAQIPEGEEESGRPGLFCNSTPLAFWEAAARAGFTLGEEGHVPARVWYLVGEPQFSELVKFPCRLGVGEELVDLLVQGIEYDPDGYYVRLCVNHGPSFVSEIDGEPVCWSAMHLSGTLAMVYTPECHRRKGYARSLAAFHIDYILGQQGRAVCHIIGDNFASEKMMASFNFKVIDEPLVWRSVYWQK